MRAPPERSLKTQPTCPPPLNPPAVRSRGTGYRPHTLGHTPQGRPHHTGRCHRIRPHPDRVTSQPPYAPRPHGPPNGPASAHGPVGHGGQDRAARRTRHAASPQRAVARPPPGRALVTTARPGRATTSGCRGSLAAITGRAGTVVPRTTRADRCGPRNRRSGVHASTTGACDRAPPRRETTCGPSGLSA